MSARFVRKSCGVIIFNARGFGEFWPPTAETPGAQRRRRGIYVFFYDPKLLIIKPHDHFTVQKSHKKTRRLEFLQGPPGTIILYCKYTADRLQKQG
jgi:hypothetical protein